MYTVIISVIMILTGITLFFSRKWQHLKWLKILALGLPANLAIYYFLFFNWYYYLLHCQIVGLLWIAVAWELYYKDSNKTPILYIVFVLAIFSLSFIDFIPFTYKVWVPTLLSNIAIILSTKHVLRHKNQLGFFIILHGFVNISLFAVRLIIPESTHNETLRFVGKSTGMLLWLVVLATAIPRVNYWLQVVTKKIKDSLLGTVIFQRIIDTSRSLAKVLRTSWNK